MLRSKRLSFILPCVVLAVTLFVVPGIFFSVHSDSPIELPVMAKRVEGEAVSTSESATAVGSTDEAEGSYAHDIQSQLVPGVGSRSAVPRQVVALSLSKLINGICLSEPKVLVIDPLLPTPLELNGSESASVAATPKRMLHLESVSPAWALEKTELNLENLDNDAIAITVKPRHRILIELSEHGTGDWIWAARAQIHWEFPSGARREASPVFELSSESGGYIFEAPPISQGRIRVEVATDHHRLQRSGWLSVGPSEWLEFKLDLYAYERSTAEILVTVVDEHEMGIPAAWVSVFEEFPTLPLVGLQVSDAGLVPLRAGWVDPDLLDSPPTAMTLESGLAGFKLRAPGDYRVATWVPGQGDVLSDIIHFEPGETRELDLIVESGASLEGRIAGELGDLASNTVKRLGSLRLVNAKTGVTYVETTEPDGSFRFEGLIAGNYLLHVGGVVDGWSGNESVIPLLTREVTIRTGQAQWIDIELESVGIRVSGHVDLDIGLEQWVFTVGLICLADEMAAAASRGAPPRTEQRVLANKLGLFAFSGLGPGRYRIVALGRRNDGRAIAFMHRDLDLREGESPPPSIALSPSGDSLRLMSDDRSNDLRQISVRVAARDPQIRFLVEQVEPLVVGGDELSVFFGLPPGEVTLASNGKDLDLEVDRKSVVQIP